MSYRVEGSCNQCGECCRVEMQYKPMLDKDFKDGGQCIYLGPDGEKYLCKITMTAMQNNVLKPADVPLEHYEYWKKECLPYPDPNRPAHTPTNRHTLMKECGFKMVLIDA